MYMSRAKKDAVVLNCKIETDIMKRLDEHCKRTGQTKTTAVERAIVKYIEFCKNSRV